MALSALDEPRAITCNDEFDLFTKHKYSLLCGGFDDGIGGVHNGYQDSAGWDAEDVGGVLLPVRRHPKESCCEGGVASHFPV